MMRRFALIACLFAAVGCRKKSSPAFYDAQGRYSVITAKLGDDAYDDPEMAIIVGELQGVPTKAKESEQAIALLTTIAGEKARVAAVKAELAKPVAAVVAGPAPRLDGPAPVVTAVAAPTDAADAGFSPQRGMSLDAFLTAYAACMDATEDVVLPGQKEPGRAFAVRKTQPCMDKFGGSDRFTKMYVFMSNKLVGEATRSEPDDSTPHGGMTADQFTKNFGDCMVASPDVTMPGAKTASQAFAVKADKACTDKFGGGGAVTKTYVFNNGKLVGESTQSVQKADGPTPAFIPGASLPSGVNSNLPPPDPSTAVTPDSNQR